MANPAYDIFNNYVLIRFTQTNVNHFTLSKLKTKQYDSILEYAQAYQPNAVYFRL